METKICTKCKLEKKLSDYHKEERNKSKLSYSCKLCTNNYRKKYNSKNRDMVCLWSKKSYAKNKLKAKEKKNEWYENNKERVAYVKKLYKLKNNEKIKIKAKIWRRNNKEKINMYNKEYIKNKRLKDPLYKMAGNLRTTIKSVLKYKGVKNIDSTICILGADFIFIKKYLERQFKKGMNWENHGLHGWHIDHIIPLASAKTEEELKTLCHYTNLQPLWAKENLNKSAKIFQVQIKLTI